MYEKISVFPIFRAGLEIGFYL